MDQNQIITDWLQYPTGKTTQGEFCPHCYRFNTRCMTVTVIGLNSDNQVLLIKRKRDPAAGWWAMPGGYVDWNETLIQTAAREYKEETNLDLMNLKFFGLYDDLNRDKDGRQNVDHCYVGQVSPNSTLKLHPDEVIEAKWFSFDNLPENIAFDHRDMLNDYLKGIKNQ